MNDYSRNYIREFPFKLKFGVESKTNWRDSSNNIYVAMTDCPREGFRQRCVEMLRATWSDNVYTAKSDEEIHRDFMKILRHKVLPNSLEHLNFQFRVEGLTLIEITHLLRHRQLHSIHAQCSADRFLQEDSCFIPSSINKSEWHQKYKALTIMCKTLYKEMIDDGVPILDARYILTRNHRYFYYFGCNLKVAMQFINQRKCTQIQPEMDNKIAHGMHHLISLIIPEIKEVISLECNRNCVYITSDDEDSSRVYYPDKIHENLIRKMYGNDSERLDKRYYLYPLTREDMRVPFNPQGEKNENRK